MQTILTAQMIADAEDKYVLGEGKDADGYCKATYNDYKKQQQNHEIKIR